MRPRVALLFLFMVCGQAISPAMAAEAITTVKAALEARGQVHRFTHTVTARGAASDIPITVISGAKQGAVLLAMAGQHGSEYSPIVATQRLGQSIKPDHLSGSLVLIHMANKGAYVEHDIQIVPSDGKNLNRVWPGRADGTLADAIAHYLSTQVYPLADAVLDIHSGDANEMLKPSWTGFYETAQPPQLAEQARALAYAFGIAHVVHFQWDVSDPSKAIWGGAAAMAMGIPSMDVEAGGRGLYTPETIEQIEKGVQRIMVHLGILERAFPPPPKPKIIRVRESVESPVTGSWVPLIEAGQSVRKGDLIGYVTDYHGTRQFEARAPMDGLLLIRLESPPVYAGKTLATIARVEE